MIEINLKHFFRTLYCAATREDQRILDSFGFLDDMDGADFRPLKEWDKHRTRLRLDGIVKFSIEPS